MFQREIFNSLLFVTAATIMSQSKSECEVPPSHGNMFKPNSIPFPAAVVDIKASNDGDEDKRTLKLCKAFIMSIIFAAFFCLGWMFAQWICGLIGSKRKSFTSVNMK